MYCIILPSNQYQYERTSFTVYTSFAKSVGVVHSDSEKKKENEEKSALYISVSVVTPV